MAKASAKAPPNLSAFDISEVRCIDFSDIGDHTLTEGTEKLVRMLSLQ
jgi:hypothetical protein